MAGGVLGGAAGPCYGVWTMTKHRWMVTTCFVLAALAIVSIVYAQVAPPVLRTSTKLIINSGGEIEVKSGASMDVESGGSLKLAGTAVTSNAAELNVLDGIAGTLTYDELDILDGVTATTDELNILDGMPAQVAWNYSSAAANVCEATLTVQDAAGATVAGFHELTVYLSDTADCAALTDTSASGTVQAKSGAGTDATTITSKKAMRVITAIDGTYILEITDTGKTAFYPCATTPGTSAINAGAQLQTADYGS